MIDRQFPESFVRQPESRLSLFLFCAVLGASVFLSACTDTSKASLPKDSETNAVKVVKTAVAKIRPMERTITVTGSFTARERATLSVKVPGRLENIVVDIGSIVKKGDVLAQIEKEDYELKLNQAQALLKQARARLGLDPEGNEDEIDLEKTAVVQQAQAVLEEAGANRNRIKALTKEKIASQAELDTAEATYRVAVGKNQDALQDARERKALFVQRRAEFDLAKKQLIDSTIRAPFDGIVQQRRAGLGEYLDIGTPLVVLAAVDPLRLQLTVPERESTRIAPGQPIRIAVGGDTNTYFATVNRVSPMLSELNRMLVIEADVPPAPALKPGLFAEANIVTSTNDPALIVPLKAITSFVGLQKAFIVKEGKVLEKSITTGRSKNGLVEILSGIADGDKVILDPGKLRSGQAVTEEADAKAR